MPAEYQCPKCGAVLPADAPKGLCPRCLMAAALEESRPAAVKATIRVEPDAGGEPLEKIDRYKILQKLGEGGCGVVYMAEQTEPVRRKVALKVIKLGMDTKQVIARFEAERQALALMDHPNIAKVLDAGATEKGRPYFVMELVKGIRITEYCDQNHLSTPERLGLFTQVCQAIQHAHQKGIIHRDIKPSNVLVTLHDGKPVPKVIDFGIAKATEQQLTEKTVFTAFGQFMGTPAYMSPEQAELSGLDIDTRSDIYALGVLLYELLTGRTPFDAKELLQAGLDEMRRRIREEEPMRPSTRLSTMVDADLTEIAEQRRSEPGKLTRFIRGDLDWIVMKCLEKDRTRRYETANGLAMDIRRHLGNEPVMACPPSAAYRFQKMVRRNKIAFAAVGAVAAALVIGLGIATWQFFEKSKAYNRAVAAEIQAKDQAAKNRQIAQFLGDMLNNIYPAAAQGRDTALLRDLLDKTAAHIEPDLTNQPEFEIKLLNVIGKGYAVIGNPIKAETMHRSALALGRKLFGNDHPDVTESLEQVAYDFWVQGKPGEAQDPAREAVVINRKLFGNETLKVAVSLDLLGLALQNGGKLVEAEGAFRESLAIRRKVFGNENVEVGHALNSLSSLLAVQGKMVEAENMARESLAIFTKLRGDQDSISADVKSTLASTLYEQGKLSEAESLFREVLLVRLKTWGSESLNTATSMSGLATVLLRQQKFAEAEQFSRECLAIREKKVPDAWYTYYTRTVLGRALLGQKKYTEAEALLLSGYEGMKQRENNIRDRRKLFTEGLQGLVQLYEATGQPDKAVEWKQKLAEFDTAEAQRKLAQSANSQ